MPTVLLIGGAISSAAIQLNCLHQAPPSPDFVAPLHPGLTCLALLWTCDLCPRELDLHVVFGKVPPTCGAPFVQGQCSIRPRTGPSSPESPGLKSWFSPFGDRPRWLLMGWSGCFRFVGFRRALFHHLDDLYLPVGPLTLVLLLHPSNFISQRRRVWRWCEGCSSSPGVWCASTG